MQKVCDSDKICCWHVKKRLQLRQSLRLRHIKQNFAAQTKFANETKNVATHNTFETHTNKVCKSDNVETQIKHVWNSQQVFETQTKTSATQTKFTTKNSDYILAPKAFKQNCQWTFTLKNEWMSHNCDLRVTFPEFDFDPANLGVRPIQWFSTLLLYTLRLASKNCAGKIMNTN